MDKMKYQKRLPTKTENKFYEALLKVGLKPEREYTPEGAERYGYRCDFAFPRQKIDVELDAYEGYDGHHGTPWRKKKDDTRNDVLTNLGWKVIRINSKLIMDDNETSRLALKIKKEIYPTNSSSNVSLAQAIGIIAVLIALIYLLSQVH